MFFLSGTEPEFFIASNIVSPEWHKMSNRTGKKISPEKVYI
jgi:hypothetical protein